MVDMKEIKKEVKEVEKTVTERKEVMMGNDGLRIHKMNINMKNKLLKDANWNDLKDGFDLNSENILKLSEHKHYPRLIEELKIVETIIAKPNNNEELGVRGNANYFVVIFEGQRFLVKSIKGMVKGYLRIVK